ncbi:cytochrome o ubiquinol oxidase subunit III [Cobetia sp. cqz5-12]|uniref:cytochrome o ubiquinol oxidase subunit III n=2 Tax=Cobetia TaxID=204286 RepID=UPI00103AAD73|nr:MULTISPECIES: cytochrome o ubiquinol oxidase subunit III [unclassified Cobetia]TCJ24870.1 cytochrome o ubiquinol oxidase subunit III [Halomonas sp. GDM18]UTV86983.1 cytochrome o ubiquinol oxidase subunit III [Cobetia litoralis]MBE2168732.1 cytochrome o ubiquinol oxidase subunit III [Cobetia sp. 2AS1]MDH2447700.1 cytochrome o ubiquinol oxidase subunit III [Cobetia sp. 2AS]NHH87002.1 Cytochrome bo(3) ubiquinol oxidase subunit 3 [Cobetia sp. MB87]
MANNAMTSHDGAHDAHDDHEHHDTNGLKVFGFWLYLLSDCILFAMLFAGYVVLSQAYAGGPTGAEIFELDFVLVETALLLASSFTYGLAMLGMNRGDSSAVIKWLMITFACGAGFIAMEIYEFHHLIVNGHGPDKSAFLSAFFTLVGTHGLHVTVGLIWMALLIFQVKQKGLTEMHRGRLMMLSLFWHFLDVIWICVFTVVYLTGVML